MNLPKDGGIMAGWKAHGWTFLSRAKSAQLLSEAISGSFSKCLRNEDRSHLSHTGETKVQKIQLFTSYLENKFCMELTFGVRQKLFAVSPA